MTNLKTRIERTLAEVAEKDIPLAIDHVSTLDEPQEIFFALTDLRKKMSCIDSWIFDMQHQEPRP